MQEAQDGSIRYRLTVYGYDDMGNRTMEKRYLDCQTAEGASGRTNTITYTYDRSNRPVRVEDSTGACLEYAYDRKGKLISESSRQDGDTFREIRYMLDETGRVLKRYERLEEDAVYTGDMPYSWTEYSYDGNGNVTKVVLPGGGVVTYTYDNDDRVISETHEEKDGDISNRICYTYDHAGNLTSQTDAEGNTTAYGYDLMDREVSRDNPDGGHTERRYDLDGRLRGEVLPSEHAARGGFAQGYRYTYDRAGRRLTATAPGGILYEQNTYDDAGRLIRQIDGARYSYDLAGRQTMVTTPEGACQQFAYDAMGNLTATTDAMGNTTSFTVDAWGRTTHITKADGSHETYTYDHAGNLLTATDGEGRTVSYRYNSRGLLASRTDAAGAGDTFRYDRDGNVAESTDRNGNRLSYTYNMYHSLTSRRSEKGDISEHFGYYPDGKLRYAIGGGMRYDYTYDCMGRLTGKSVGGRALLSYTYDPNGNRTGLTDPTGKRTEYAYDYADRLMEVRDNEKRQARYTYNPDGTISTLEIGDCGGEGVLYTEYSYDRDKNLTALRTLIRRGAPGGAYGRLTDNHYSYDMAGNCIMKQTPAGETRYRYDSLYQLTEAVYPQGRREQFTYDRAGNRLTRTTQDIREEYSHDTAGRLTKRSVYEMLKNPELPDAGQQVAEPKTYHYEYDRQGNTLSDGENTYRYDSLNRIVEVQTKNGDIQKNRYDGEGLRAELEENGRLVAFIFDGDKVVSEKTDNNTIRYIRGYELISSDSAAAKTYYHYASDELGSTTHLTDENGNVYNYYEYDAFGNFLTKAENVPNRFCFTGEQYDPLTSQYYLRARFYNPAIGRSLNEDTYYGDGLNLYAYCHNNPAKYVDPTGHWCEEKQRETEQKYRDKGYSDKDAEIMANYERLREEQGVSAAEKYLQEQAKSSKSGSETSRTNWGAEHGKGNVKHNNAIETELDNAASNGATDIRKNRVQRDSNGNRVYAPDGKYTKPDASYVIDGQRYNTNYVSNYGLDNIDELNREIEAFNRMCDADPDSITQLIFKY